MFEINKDYFEGERNKAHEREIKKALSEKFSHYDKKNFENTGDCSNNNDYTEITIDRKRIRVKKENITILDISAYTQNSSGCR